MDGISKYDLIELSKKQFQERFVFEGDSISIAPGRINLIGEHTDYNSGFAMPIAINRWVCSVVKKRTDQKVNVYSSNFKKSISADLNSLNSGELWEKYTLGCIQIVKDRFNIKNGVDVLINGNIPIGFGVSSSAALEVSFLGALLSVYGLDISLPLILKLSSHVEHKYLGIKSGILDQYTSLYSKKEQPLLIDFSNLSHIYVESNIENASWVLINSMVKRNLVDSEYNNRVKECKEGLSLINRITSKTLSFNEITKKDLELIKSYKIPYKRLSHLLSENERVLSMRNVLKKGNLKKIGELLNQSHESLSKSYNVSCKEIEEIIKISKKQDGFYGGRIMGGGFGGCTINLVDINNKDIFIKKVKSLFMQKYNYSLEVLNVESSSGFKLF